MNGGIGDMLLLTIIFRKIFEDFGEKVITISAFKEIFILNQAVQKVDGKENPLINLRKLVGFDYYDITYRCSKLVHRRIQGLRELPTIVAKPLYEKLVCYSEKAECFLVSKEL